MYKEISRMIAGNHHTALRHTCSEKALAEIKKEVKARERGGWDHIDWNLIGFGREYANRPPGSHGRPERLGQERRVRAVHRQIQLATDVRRVRQAGAGGGGGPDQVLSVEDVWVFERASKCQTRGGDSPLGCRCPIRDRPWVGRFWIPT